MKFDFKEELDESNLKQEVNFGFKEETNPADKLNFDFNMESE